MRTMLLIFLMSLPASAFDAKQVTEQYYDVRAECRIGETEAGRTLTADEISKQCETVAVLGKELREHGYCWYVPEQEWTICQ